MNKGINKLENYIQGNWITGDGDGQTLFDAVNGDPVATATSKGLDFAAALDYGRKVSSASLRKMSFHEEAGC